MQDNELHGKSSEQNDKLMSEFAVTRRQSRSLYRNWVVLTKKTQGNALQSQTNVFKRISSSSIKNDLECSRESSSTLIEDRADEIVRHMEQSQTLMEDNPKSNNDRIETLREMTEYLTLKRSVKRKLIKSVSSTSKPLSFSKRLKYRLSIFFSKVPVSVKHFISGFELWYSSLKVIEGHFGSSVASYFKFLRKLFLLNACIFFLMFLFIMIPQLLFRFIQYIEGHEVFTLQENETNLTLSFLGEKVEVAPVVMFRSNPYQENGDFRLGNLFTGEGFLTNTILFYGYYTNTSLKIFEGYSYNIPASYFFSSAVCYMLIFFFLFISVAVSYRKCYIEASGGMNNTFTNKVLCGWDFGISAKQAAELKSRSIYIEIKELLDDLSKPARNKTCVNTFYTTLISFSLNSVLLFLLAVGGMYSWKYLDQQMAKADTATTMMMWLILTLVIAVAPVLFSLIGHLEGFESQSSALYMTLVRTFTLYAVVIAVVVAYRLNRSTDFECWETILGQDMYRLVLLDFIFGLIGTALSEFIRYRIFVQMWKGIGCPEFDIARSTMNLIYNQTLFYLGLYFSPVLSLVITIKLFITFYIKKYGAVYNCKPFGKPWKASQAHTVYLSIAFFAFFCVVIAYGYIITSVKTSNCGPFRGEKFMYESLLEEMLSKKDSTILTVLYYITRPGVVGIVLMAMGLGVYYMRAVALARIHVVKHLRHLLRLKAEDRKLLLSEISKYSKPQDSGNKDDSHHGEGIQSSELQYVNQKFFKSDECFPKSGEKIGKLDGQRLKKAKFAFSSLANLQNESDENFGSRSNQSSIFASVQNINGYTVERSPKLQIDLKKSLKDQSDGAQASGSEWEDVYVDDVAKTSYDPSEHATNEECLDNDSSTDYVNNSQLNFNPVFTKSVPLQSDDDEPERSEIEVDVNAGDRLTVPDRENDNIQAQNEDSNSQSNYSMLHRFEERVPSRISFDSDSDHKLSKKKKHRRD